MQIFQRCCTLSLVTLTTLALAGCSGGTSPSSSNTSSTPSAPTYTGPYVYFTAEDAGEPLVVDFEVVSSNAALPANTFETDTGVAFGQTYGGITVDSAGNIYVATLSDPGSSVPEGILVFAPGATGLVTPTRFITGSNTGLAGGDSIVVDSAGNIYTADYSRNIYEFAAGANGNVAPIRSFPYAGGIPAPADGDGIISPNAIAVDSKGYLYVLYWDLDYSTNNVQQWAIAVFSPTQNGNVTPVRNIYGPLTGIYGTGVTTQAQIASRMALDAEDNIYVATYVEDPGNSFSYSNQTILEFAAGANGNVAPIRTITGNNTGMLGMLNGLCFDSAGNIYTDYILPNNGGIPGLSGVSVFSPTANGNATPDVLMTFSKNSVGGGSFMACH